MIPDPLGKRNIADLIYLEFSKPHDMASQKKQISVEDSAEEDRDY